MEITLASKYGAYGRFYRSDKDNLAQQKRIAELKRTGAEKSQLEVISDSICRMYQANRTVLTEPHIVFSSPLSSNIAYDRTRNAVIDLNKRKQVSE